MHLATIAALMALFYGVTPMYENAVPDWSKDRLVAYTSLSRVAWAVGLAILSVLWFSAPGNYISRALSASFWEPITRLSYGAYVRPSTLSSSGVGC